MIVNKLVRDKIPEIIKAKGENPVTRVLSEEEFLKELNKKLQEEVNEYLADKSLEELADVLEIIHGILSVKGKSFEEIEVIRKNKADNRGSFKKRIFLESINQEE